MDQKKRGLFEPAPAREGSLQAFGGSGVQVIQMALQNTTGVPRARLIFSGFRGPVGEAERMACKKVRVRIGGRLNALMTAHDVRHMCRGTGEQSQAPGAVEVPALVGGSIRSAKSSEALRSNNTLHLMTRATQTVSMPGNVRVQTKQAHACAAPGQRAAN